MALKGLDLHDNSLGNGENFQKMKENKNYLPIIIGSVVLLIALCLCGLLYFNKPKTTQLQDNQQYVISDEDGGNKKDNTETQETTATSSKTKTDTDEDGYLTAKKEKDIANGGRKYFGKLMTKENEIPDIMLLGRHFKIKDHEKRLLEYYKTTPIYNAVAPYDQEAQGYTDDSRYALDKDLMPKENYTFITQEHALLLIGDVINRTINPIYGCWRSMLTLPINEVKALDIQRYIYDGLFAEVEGNDELNSYNQASDKVINFDFGHNYFDNRAKRAFLPDNNTPKGTEEDYESNITYYMQHAPYYGVLQDCTVTQQGERLIVEFTAKYDYADSVSDKNIKSDIVKYKAVFYKDNRYTPNKFVLVTIEKVK